MRRIKKIDGQWYAIYSDGFRAGPFPSEIEALAYYRTDFPNSSTPLGAKG